MALDTTCAAWRTINSTYGITRLVSIAGTPTPVPDALVTELRDRFDDEGVLLPPKLLHAGDDVVLTKGPFAEFIATVERIAPDRRVWVLIEMMGAQTRVGLDPEHVRHA